MAERIDAKAAAAITGDTLRTIQTKAAQGLVPSAAKIFAGRWTFDRNTLLQWVREQRLEAAENEQKAVKKAEFERQQSALDPYKGQKVYVIRCSNRVKIGTTLNIRDRLRTIQTGNPYPVELLLVIEGDEEIEAMLHLRFERHRRRGEWFAYSDEIKRWIARGGW